MLKGAAKSIRESEYGLPDRSDYYGVEEGFVKGAGRVAAAGLPSVLGLLAAAGATGGLGALAAGGTGVTSAIAGGAGALGYTVGTAGLGSYDLALEDSKAKAPWKSEEEHKSYAMEYAAPELLGEIAGNTLTLGLGKFLGGANPAKAVAKAGVQALMGTGEFTTAQVLSSLIGKQGIGTLTKALAVGGLGDGASEVATELMQRAAAENHGMQHDPTDIMELFAGSVLLGSGVTGVGYASGARNIKRMKDSIEYGLTNEDEGIRMSTVDAISKHLGNIDPEASAGFRSFIDPLAKEGPVSLETVLKKQEEKQEVATAIIESPQAVINEKLYGPTPKREGMTELELENKRMVDLRNTMHDVQAAKRGPQPSEEMLVSLETELGQREELEKEKQRIALEMEGHAKRIKGFMQANEVSTGKLDDDVLQEAKRIVEFDAEDNAKKRRIIAGMDKVNELSNQLDSTEDLVEAGKIQKEIKSIFGLLKDEVSGGLKRDIPNTRPDGLTPNQVRQMVKLTAFDEKGIQMSAGEALRYLDDDISIYEQLRTCVGKA
jgi:hypothetical protein